MTAVADAYLYVIGEADGPHKVGLSVAPRRRLAELQIGSPRGLALKRTSTDRYAEAAKIENYAHWLLRESAVRGEWFSVTDEAAWVALTAAVEAVAQGLDVPSPPHSEPGKVGRPPIKRDVVTKPLLVRMDGDMHARIVQCVGKKRMAQFARDAIEEKLQREEASTPLPDRDKGVR